MAAETMTFKLEGDETEYEFPQVDDFDIDEWVVVWDYCGLTLDDFMPPLKDDNGNVIDEEEEAERQRRLTHPGFTKAVLHIAYQRSHPDMKPAQIKAVIGRAKLVSIVEQQFEQLAEAAKEEEPEIPPASTSEPVNASSGSSLESGEKTSTKSESSSQALENDSDGPAGLRAITGTGG